MNMEENTRGQASGPQSGICLGSPEAFGRLPASVTVDGEPYWLVRGAHEGAYRLLSAICPHAGGDVLRHDGMFFCPLHFWTFEQTDGACQNIPGERLMRRDVELREDGRLYAVGWPY